MTALQRITRLLDHRGIRTTTIVFLMAVAALLVVIATYRGPGLWPDSVNYVSAARSYAASGELTLVSGQTLTIWPPGLPVILGTGLRMGLDLQVLSVTLNVICVALSVLLSYLLAWQALESRVISVAVAATVAFSSSTVGIYSMLSTEPLFMTLTLLVLFVLIRAVRRRAITWWEILAVGAAVSAATSLRFVGFILIPIVTSGVLLATRTRGWTRALVAALVATGLSSIGLLAVALRNISLGVSPLGERSPSGYSALRVMKDTALTIGLYVYPSTGPSPWIPVLVSLPLMALLVYGFARSIAIRWLPVALLGVYTATYWLSLWYSQFATTIDPISNRLTVPVFASMLIVAGFAIQELSAQFANHPRQASETSTSRPMQTAIALLFGLLLLSLALNTLQSVRAARAGAINGIGYNSTARVTSPLALALVDLPEGGIAANDPWLAYWVSERHPMHRIPMQNHWYPPARTEIDIQALRDAITAREVTYLAFFDHFPTALTPSQLERAGIAMRPIGSFADGELFEAVRPT